MNRSQFLKAMVAVAFAMVMFAVVGAGNTASAQCPPDPKCNGVYWVNYNYVYPPALATIPVQVDFASGYSDITSETVDGHYTYNWDPAMSPAVSVTVLGVIIPIPTAGPVLIPTANGVLRVETNCNPCLEIKLSY